MADSSIRRGNKWARAATNHSKEKNKIRHLLSEYHRHPNNLQALTLAKAIGVKIGINVV